MTKLLRPGELRIVLILLVFIIITGVFFQNPLLASSSPLDTGGLGIKVLDAAQPLPFDETVATFASDCVTPKTDFILGETVCGKVSNPQLGTPPQRRFEFANPGNYVVQIGPDVTADPQTSSFTLPSTQTSILGGSILVDNRGAWRFASVDSSAEGRAVAYFTVHDPIADLAITKTDGSATAVPGTSVIYTITASNNGPNAAMGSTVADVFLGAITSANWTCIGLAGGTCSASGSGNINETVNLPSGGSVTFTVTATVSPNSTGSLSNTAIVTAPVGVVDPNPINNSGTDTDTLTPQADLVITKSDGVTTVYQGGSTVYTIVASNNGPSSVIGATVTDTFAASITSATWTCAGQGGATCTPAGSGNINQVVTLPVGSSVIYTATASIVAGATGTLVNTATVTAPLGVTDPTPGNNSATDTDILGVNISGNIQQYIPGGPNTNLSGVTVTATGPGGSFTAMTNASGNYALNGLQSGGTYMIAPTLFGKAFDPITRTYHNLATNLTGVNFIAYTNPGGIPRTVNIVNSNVVPGQIVAVPIVMNSLGNEKSVAFSLIYDINPFASNPTASCGSSAPGCTVTFNNSTSGKIGVTVTAAGVFNAGPREVAKVNFQSLPTNLSNTPVTFGNSPTNMVILDSANNPLQFVSMGGFVVFAQGLEGDLADRKMGDGLLLANDVTIERQFVVGLSIPDPLFNEFQRADTSPGVSKGDGQLDATDVIQERRYVVGLDAPTSAGGPGSPSQPILGPVAPPDENNSETAAGGRTLHVTSTNAAPGTKATIFIDLGTLGDEVATSFTLNFDQTKLRNPVVELGSGLSADAVLTVNSKNEGEGKLGILVDSTNVLAVGRILSVTFDVSPSSGGGSSPVTFSSSLAKRGTSDANGNHLATSYENGAVNIARPAAAGFTILGRVLTPDGRGIRNARVTVADQSGRARTVTTNSFGYYSFDGVASGATYTIGVSSRQYRFASRVVTVTDNLSDVDFVAKE